MDGAAHFVAAERRDHSLDLPPMAKASDIAVIATALGAHCRFEARIVAVAFDEVGGVGQGRSSVDEGRVHANVSNSVTVERLPTSIVNLLLTMFNVAQRLLLCHGRAMPSSTRAGGCFLTLCILAGFPLGLAIGNPMKGILIGTGVGIALAIVTWLIDRQRRR